MQVSFDSPTYNCTFKIRINFKSTKTNLKMTEIPLAIKTLLKISRTTLLRL